MKSIEVNLILDKNAIVYKWKELAEREMYLAILDKKKGELAKRGTI